MEHTQVDGPIAAPRRRSGLGSRLLLLLVGILLPLLALEVVLRLNHVRVKALSVYQPAADPIVSYVGKPHARPDINALGFRDREHAIAKPPGVFRILVLGDSVTNGYGVEVEEMYTRRLESLLAERDGERYEVVNFGLPQYSTVQEVTLFRERGAQMRPDLVIVGYVLNDPTRSGRINDFFEHDRAPSLAAEWLTRQVKEVLRLREPVELLDDCEPFDYYSRLNCDAGKWATVSASFRELGSLSRADGFPVLVVIFPLVDGACFDDYRWGSFHRRVAEEAAANGFACLDLLPVFAQRSPSELWIKRSDDLHPNPLGHRIAATAIYRALVDLGVD